MRRKVHRIVRPIVRRKVAELFEFNENTRHFTIPACASAFFVHRHCGQFGERRILHRNVCRNAQQNTPCAEFWVHGPGSEFGLAIGCVVWVHRSGPQRDFMEFVQGLGPQFASFGSMVWHTAWRFWVHSPVQRLTLQSGSTVGCAGEFASTQQCKNKTPKLGAQFGANNASR